MLRAEIARAALRILHAASPAAVYRFRDMALYIPRGVFNPVFAVSTALAISHIDARGRVADLGTGSGAIAIALAKSPQVETVCAYDISPLALATARVNAEINRVAHKVAICPTRKALLAAAPYDVVTANPPYLPLDPRDEKDKNWCAGRHLEAIREITAQATHILKPGGTLYITASTLTDMKQAAKILAQHGLTPKIKACTTTPLDHICLIEAHKTPQLRHALPKP
ncbi:methyltransferase small [Pyrobaculum islandicum DSM 4184]|uniref:Methyltransferase small n=1 Tax=Pyrobaculum islandicum (strain DSM 4184 / JCM 9189 / GEO3) TaxID=384616 RepID=A1RUS7_PYRIL|nr:methyltransferase [Pyrobaculum islandicum]ABL88709.1 methyltransferase small [Pyrobaculum islandicum DSM 4184]